MIEKYVPCSWCERLFISEIAVVNHIRSRSGHGRQKCSNCGKSLSRCKDITGVGQAFVCSNIKVGSAK